MQKAWKVMGVSTIKPEGLPGAFTVVEKEIGCVHQIPTVNGRHVNFVEAKNGDVVVYREGVSNSNFKIPAEDISQLIKFLMHVHTEQGARIVRDAFSKCPGTPHRGHFSTAFICPLDQS